MLVLGGGGWFGSTMLDLCAGLDETQVLVIGSRARSHQVRGRAWPISTFDPSLIRGFAPTIVANFAFLTRERVVTDGLAEFTRVNEALTDQFIDAAQLPSVRIGLTISSGAAITEPQSPYGSMKLAEEKRALACATTDRAIVVGRVFSVSGPFVGRPADYAFSDLVQQALRGAIEITATTPVFRRYASVSDVLEVCLLRAFAGFTGVIESGGRLVEMGELAEAVRQIVSPAATIGRPALTSHEPSIYASDNVGWELACRDAGIATMPLDAQIAAVAAALGNPTSR